MFNTRSLRQVLQESIQDSRMACVMLLQENGDPIASVSAEPAEPGLSTSSEALAKVYSVFVSSAWKQLDKCPTTEYTCVTTDVNIFAFQKLKSTSYLVALVADVHTPEALVVRRLVETARVLQSKILV